MMMLDWIMALVMMMMTKTMMDLVFTYVNLSKTKINIVTGKASQALFSLVYVSFYLFDHLMILSILENLYPSIL